MGKALSVIFLIDALGWEIVRRFDFCGDVLARRAPLGTVLGYSSAAIPSLLSGTTPAEHGAWSMYRLARGRSPFWYLKLLPPLPHALEWRVRRLTRRFTDRRGLIDGYYDLYEIPLRMLAEFDVAQHQDPYVPGGLSRDTVFDGFVRDRVDYQLWYYRTPEADNMAEALAAVGGAADVLFVYTAELDELMHRRGIFDDAVRDKLQVYESFISDVIEAADRHQRSLRLYVLSDHGMTDVTEVYDPWGDLERRGLRLGRDYLGFYDATMGRFWCDDRAEREIRERVAGSGKARVLTDADLERYGCFFPEGEYGRVIALANPGVMVAPSFMGREPLRAMHGYDPDDRFSKGCFLTNDTSGDLPVSILDFKEYLQTRTGGAD